ncbi:hypothetical protein HRG_004030 [Hirsutella rhossiliensis]|uniref:Uncharacterized protein n=1 Tax=Hirsutella rhossiliensis TaxID=111463 RepID=A0A9P8N592_9HYPO|nr:uncharacterized protein HRG_04030 [Hirsutella rhossiliensis]KAH0966014.1 hypothetical protein HRG_04030 [Hirsutella rhossiliensis]
MQVPFLDDSLMGGPLYCTLKDFELPCLRQCAFEPSTIAWEDKLGGGLDGYVWKVRFGEMGPFALKVFWDTDPPDFYHYYAAQRECQNASLFQMMEVAIAQAAAESKPIQVYADPRTQSEALDNLYAFSDEGRLTRSSRRSFMTVSVTSMPRMRKCFGWLRLSGDVFHALPLELKAPSFTISKIQRSMSFDKEYIALVYEFIEEGRNDEAVVEEVDRFFWLAGFSHTLSPSIKNWKSGVLVDLADMVHAGGYGWKKQLYGPRTADMILIE